MGSTAAPFSFTIPDKFKDELEYVNTTDTRTDKEIYNALIAPDDAPITSEKNIWGFWHAGFEAMPAWCQRNVIDWVRINPDWSIRILDNVPGSAHYALKYVPKDQLPASFIEHTMDGPFTGPHSADLLRGPCLYQYGGVWLDVGAILSREMDRICWDKLTAPGSKFQVAAPLLYDQAILNHFIAARKGNEFIKRWHALFLHCWQDKANSDGLINHPLLADIVPLGLERYKSAGDLWDWKVPLEKTAEYVTQILCWWKVAGLEDTGDGFSGVDVWMNNTFLFSLTEDWPAEVALGFGGNFGNKLMDALALRVDGDKESEQYKQAEDLVWTILARSCMQKVTHGGALTHSLMLGTLWDMPENEGKDCAPGTFAELLRKGAVMLRQKRPDIVAVEPPKPAATYKKGLFEV